VKACAPASCEPCCKVRKVRCHKVRSCRPVKCCESVKACEPVKCCAPACCK
jgi:hypothetical protein